MTEDACITPLWVILSQIALVLPGILGLSADMY